MNHRIPSFFKVCLLPTSSEKLLIPIALGGHIRGALPEQALLRNHRGKVWHVTITNARNKFYFTDGWAKFVGDNNVQHGDFLVFDFDGSNIFDVKLYGNTTCEKKVTETQEEELGNDDVADGAGESTKYEDEEGSHDETEESTGDESDESYKEGQEYEEDDEYENETEEEEEFEAKNNEKGKGKQKIVKSGKGLQMALASSYDDCKGKELIVAKNRLGTKGSSSEGLKKIRKITKDSAKSEGRPSDASDDEDEVFKHGVIAWPINPYFVTKLRATRTNELYVPTEVIKDYNLELPEKMTIIDERKREWKSKVKVWKDGRTWLTKGWRAFRKWNDFKWEDRCICEFVNRRGQSDMCLKMTILRAGSWLHKEDK